MDESVFCLIMAFFASAVACFAIIACNDPVVKKISDRKIVRAIIHIIFGALTFIVSFAMFLICFFGK